MPAFRTCLLALALTASAAAAQDPPTPGHPAPEAIDPLYTAAPTALASDDIASLQQRLADWPQLSRYREANAHLEAPAPGERRVVFYGDSITDNWGRQQDTTFFPGKPYVNRGIAGQTTPQMLVRFRQDVIDLKPAAVLILAGTNDIAGNSGVSTPEMIEDNLRSMAELARAHHIRVILASILPVSDYPWRRGLQPADKVRALNAWIKQYAAANGAVYLDYYGAMANQDGGLDAELASDGVHPTPAGYARMAPLAQQAIERALSH